MRAQPSGNKQQHKFTDYRKSFCDGLLRSAKQLKVTKVTKVTTNSRNFFEQFEKIMIWLNQKILGKHKKNVYSVTLLSNYQATLSPENLENISNFESWGLTLVAYLLIKKSVAWSFKFFVERKENHVTLFYHVFC